MAWLLYQAAWGTEPRPPSDVAFRVYHGHKAGLDAIAPSGNTAIHIGAGYFLTAAHVAQPSHPGEEVGILIRGTFHPAAIIRLGSLDSVDVALLRIGETELPPDLRLPSATALCATPLAPGTAAWVVAPGGATAERILGLADVPPGIPERFASLITETSGSGQSGSGVFPSSSECLAGIVSRVVHQTSTRADGTSTTSVLAKYFVSAEEISHFLGDSLPPPNRPPPLP